MSDIAAGTGTASAAERSTPQWSGVPTLVARLIVGGAFIHYAIQKIIAPPTKFLHALQNYDILPVTPPQVITVTATVLPWIELVLGVCLVLGIARRGSAALSFVMLVVFTVAIGWLARDYLAAHPEQAFLSLKLDCGCGGEKINVAMKLAVNTALIALSGFAAISSSRRFAVRPFG